MCLLCRWGSGRMGRRRRGCEGLSPRSRKICDTWGTPVNPRWLRLVGMTGFGEGRDSGWLRDLEFPQRD
jgi:hypothetical protein